MYYYITKLWDFIDMLTIQFFTASNTFETEIKTRYVIKNNKVTSGKVNIQNQTN